MKSALTHLWETIIRPIPEIAINLVDILAHHRRIVAYTIFGDGRMRCLYRKRIRLSSPFGFAEQDMNSMVQY